MLHHKLVEGYRRSCGGVWWQGQDDGYFYEKICWHLREAGRLEELRELLLDYRWIEAKLKYKGANSLPEDYALLPDDQELKLVGRAMTQSARVLSEYPEQLPNQITGRLMGMGLPGLDKLVGQAQQAEVKGFRLLSPTLIGADSLFSRTFEGHKDGVRAVAITPDNTQMVSASNDNTLKLWDLASGQFLRSFVGHNEGVNAVAITPDGNRAISVYYDDSLKLWDLASGQLLRSFVGHTHWVIAVAITPDGNRAISASWDNTLKLWDLASGQLLHSLEGHKDRVKMVAINPDGNRAISASDDHTLKLWDLASGQLLYSFEEHGSVIAVAITPDGNRAISTSDDETLKLWNLQNGETLAIIPMDATLECCAISPDGKTVVGGDVVGNVHFLRLEI